MDDLDDLFGDTAPLQLPVPLSPALIRHINEASLSGCYRKAEWSRAGALAHISHDRSNVLLQNLSCDDEDGQIKLSPHRIVENVTAVGAVLSDLVHLSWDPTGVHLAVFDARGHFAIFSTYHALNRLPVSKKWNTNPDDDLEGVVGAMWLTAGQTGTNFFRPSIKESGRWEYKMNQQKVSGPRNPFGTNSSPLRATLITVTKDGIIRVVYQDRESRWREMTTDSERVKGKADFISHAAMCPERGDTADSILVATYNSQKELHVYRIRLDFEKAAILSSHLTMLSSCFPSVIDAPILSFPTFDSLNTEAALTTLEFVPAGPESKTTVATGPYVLTFFSYVGSDIHGNDMIGSIMTKWTFNQEDASLHTCFDTLAAGKTGLSSSTPNEKLSWLRRSTEMFIPRTLLSLHYINLSTVMAMAFDDGTIEFRDSHSLQLLERDGPEQISSLHQIGFAFPANVSCLSVCMSPNSSAAFSLDEHGFPSLRLLQYADPSKIMDEALLEIIAEAFVMQISIALRPTTGCVEDLTYAMRLFTSQYLNLQFQSEYTASLTSVRSFNQYVMTEIYRLGAVTLDHANSDQVDLIQKIAFLPRCLGLQAVLNFAGYAAPKPLDFIMAHVILSLRFLTMVLSVPTSKNKEGQESEIAKKPELIIFLVPLVSWLLSLLTFIVDELFTMLHHFETAKIGRDHIDINLINQYIRESQSPAMPLLFISLSRLLLRHSCRMVRTLAAIGSKLDQDTLIYRIYSDLEMIIHKSHIGLSTFETITKGVHEGVAAAYEAAKLSEQERTAGEENMLIRAQIPHALLSPARNLLFSTLESLKEEVNEAELYLSDITSLNVTNDISTMQNQKTKPMDSMQKISLDIHKRYRRCIRCCSMMNDVLPYNTYNTVAASFAKNCYCQSQWMLLDAIDKDKSIHMGI